MYGYADRVAAGITIVGHGAAQHSADCQADARDVRAALGARADKIGAGAAKQDVAAPARDAAPELLAAARRAECVWDTVGTHGLSATQRPTSPHATHRRLARSSRRSAGLCGTAESRTKSRAGTPIRTTPPSSSQESSAAWATARSSGCDDSSLCRPRNERQAASTQQLSAANPSALSSSHITSCCVNEEGAIIGARTWQLRAGPPRAHRWLAGRPRGVARAEVAGRRHVEASLGVAQ